MDADSEHGTQGGILAHSCKSCGTHQTGLISPCCSRWSVLTASQYLAICWECFSRPVHQIQAGQSSLFQTWRMAEPCCQLPVQFWQVYAASVLGEKPAAALYGAAWINL